MANVKAEEKVPVTEVLEEDDEFEVRYVQGIPRSKMLHSRDLC